MDVPARRVKRIASTVAIASGVNCIVLVVKEKRTKRKKPSEKGEGMKSGKVWGLTELIHHNPVLEFHRVEIKEGGYCSKHKHQYKWNGFFVESGSLQIKVWKNYGNDNELIDITVLNSGDFMQVKPGEYHEFRALKETIAFELYWAEFDPADIVRESVGGTSDR